ncbi:hypothetical protein [Sphingomicrobium nitratireducens]|uniref:hypothetical protein n=1 Tax=Sphingomicrobium nitratireducens TaxID=2964666 RepID=UPI00223ED211|nr:hypothetical protein [Sphingomicrobium nitratireducens]
MVTEKTNLPEGTDKIIPGAAKTSPAAGTPVPPEAEVLTEADTMMSDTAVITAEPTAKERAVAKIKEGGDTVAREAAGKARGLVGQGLERSSEAIGNIGRLVGDTAEGLDDRLGAEYGDYARKAAAYLDDTAKSLAAKDPDELIDDTRSFVRKSPGIALAGAAIVGFALARLVQSGLDAERDRD